MKHLTLGFNSTTRHLEALAQKSFPKEIEVQHAILSNSPLLKANSGVPKDPKPMAAIFVSRIGQPSVMYSHLPLLLKTAALASPSCARPRLVTLPKGAETRLGAAIGVPRVGLIGLLEDATPAVELIDFVRLHTPEFEESWLGRGAGKDYRPLNIKVSQTNNSSSRTYNVPQIS